MISKMKVISNFKDSSYLLKDLRKLKEIAWNDGVLYFPELLDKTKILDLRNQIMEVCNFHGWIKMGTNPIEGVANPSIKVNEGKDPKWLCFYKDILKIRDFHALALDENLLGIFAKLFNNSVLPHSRNICRLVFPKTSKYTTPPHQDNHPIGGSENTWTAWIPCGDCPKKLGGLAIAQKSHKFGKLKIKPALGPGGHKVKIPRNQVWLSGDFKCGDVLIFNSLTIHQGLNNLSQYNLRSSLDFRYQPLNEPIREDSLKPHGNLLSWEDIYQNWDKEDPIKYYWKNWKLNIIRK